MGYKTYSDSYLMSLTKAQIIELLRVTEHNFLATEEALNNSAKAGMEIAEKYDRAKELLKAAVEDIKYLINHAERNGKACDRCKYGNEMYCYADDCSNDAKWRYEAKALALIGEEEEESERGDTE